MPELPDIVVYIDRLKPLILERQLARIELKNPFVLRTAEPPIGAVAEKRVRDIRRMGKRIVLAFEQDLFLIIHLMIAGRLRWRPIGSTPPGGKLTLAALHFPPGTPS